MSLGHDSQDYRPAFLDHFERKEQEQKASEKESSSENRAEGPSDSGDQQHQQQQQLRQVEPEPPASQQAAMAGNNQLQRQFEQIAGGRPIGGGSQVSTGGGEGDAENAAARFQKSLLDGDLDFVS